uniref:RRM domain-containing protein n=1 Tax=Davidia involucrata TaxID=16924 RepID=A0A5B6YVE5_DAVIN
MDSADRVDDRTFGVNFTVDGVAKLRESVTDKLKEFMGDYTDDTLVEYVIVLLKNGRRKEEARNELNVFLGDDSYPFVSWLWDHLGSNLDLYLQPRESNADEVTKAKPKSGEQTVRNDSHPLDSDSDRGKSDKLSRSRHNREWKGLVRDADEPPPLRSSVIDNVHIEERTHGRVGRVKHSLSPRPTVQKKRSRPDERHQTKREVVSQATIGAPRRLLQFAVRDAVATSRSSNLTTEPALKRLRSVVSTSTEVPSLEDHPQRIRSVARVPNAATTAIKAVAEAAKDVKVRSSGNVFDRLGRGMDVSQVSDQLAEFREAAVEDVEYGDLSRIPEETRSTYLRRRDYTGEYVENMTMLESDTGMASDSASDNEGYDDVNVMSRRAMDVSQTGTSGGNQGEDSLSVQYSVAKNADEITRKPWKDQDQPAAVANTSQKIVNISVNVNTWKPPHYQEPSEVPDMDSRKSVQDTEAGAGKPGVRLMKENSNPITVGNGNVKPAADAQKEPQNTLPSAPMLYSTGRPTEDADSRTIFVNNVHFAATKDSLSRHFNKFGEVLKVVIVTDAATGQPKGSAYVEFMRKEAAEHALSLDGTSFMSRILKVARKSSVHQEAAPIMTWPRIARGSPFAAPRFPRVPFPRGMPTVYRSRLPIKPGARSLQWRRDAPATPTESGFPASSNNIPSPTARSLTYVRTEPKTNGNSGTA